MHNPQHTKMMGPLGQYNIARSQLERIGYNPLEASNPMGEPMSGGGGGGFGFSLGSGRGPNQMEQTIAAHNYPGGFKVATDQYAARYSDQLNEAALLELKDKYPQGPANGGTWDDFAAQRQSNINNYYKTGELWGPNGATGRTESTPIVKNIFTPVKVKSQAPLSGGPDRDRSGLANRVVNFGSGGSSSRGGRRGARAGRSAIKNSNPSRGRRYGL